jgi:hypothetical protein
MELLRPRQADGSLPEIDFLRPTAGSVLVGAGAENGLTPKGTRPDIGALGPRPKR